MDKLILNKNVTNKHDQGSQVVSKWDKNSWHKQKKIKPPELKILDIPEDNNFIKLNVIYPKKEVFINGTSVEKDYLDLYGFPSNHLQNIINDVQKKWNSIILNFAEGLEEIVDDGIKIEISFPQMSLGVLGGALTHSAMYDDENPTFGQYFPTSGSIWLNIDYLIRDATVDTDKNNTSKSALYYTLLHEVGHIIGITNTLLGTDNFLSNVPTVIKNGKKDGSPYTYFAGKNATKWYKFYLDQSFPHQYPEVFGVPIEEEGGAGTAGAHWDEGNIWSHFWQTFYMKGDHDTPSLDHELMTGISERGQYMPLSGVTIGALEDFGYQVSYKEIEEYKINNVNYGSDHSKENNKFIDL